MQIGQLRCRGVQPWHLPLTANSLEILAARCPNLIGFKDGIGDIRTDGFYLAPSW
jgi:dihydrodipicolinate synthase/N-acetylneuraminate lyase